MKEAIFTPKDYIKSVPEEKREALVQLRATINDHLPPGYVEQICYGMLGWVVPIEKYPAGYLGNPDQPLPFINLAAQKNYLSLYHYGLYADPELSTWFDRKYAEITRTKINRGKSCIRFTKLERIPFDLIGELCGKQTPEDLIWYYESSRKK